MKKVKVIFDDGSVADIDEADFAEAEKAGAKRHVPNKAKSLVSFEDGSMAEIDNKDTAEAKKFGAKIIAPEKKNEAAPIQSLGGTSPSQTTDSPATHADTTVSMVGTIKPQTVQPAQPTPEGWTAPDFAAIDKKQSLFPKQYEQVLQAKDFATKNPSKAIDAFNSIKDFQRFSDKTVAKFDRDNGVYIDENGQPKTAFKEGDIVTDLPTDRPMNDGITYKSGFAQFINGAWKPAPEPPNPTFTTDANPLADVVVSAFAKKKGGKTLIDLTGEQYSEDDDYNRAVMIANKPDDKIDDTEFIDMVNRVSPNEKDIVYESLWSNRFAEGGKKLPAFLSLLPEVTSEYRKILTDKPNYVATQEGNFTALSEAVTKAYELDKEVWEPMNGDVNNYVDSKEFFDMSERAKKGEDVRAYFEQPNVKLIIDRAEKQRKGYGVVTQIGRMFPKRMANEEALFQKQQEDVAMLDKIANAFKSAYVGLKDGLKEVVQFADEKVSAITGSTDEEIRMKSRMNSTEDGEAAVADYVPENFVNGFMKMVGGVAPAFATGGLGTMGKLTTAAYFGLGSAQATIKEYRQNGLDEKTANIAGGINGALMALATWGLGGHPEIKGFQPSFETTQMFLNPATREAGSKQFAKELLASKFVNFGKGLAGNVKSAAELRIAEQVHVMMNDYVNKITGSTLNTESGGVEDFIGMVGSFAMLHGLTTIAKRKTYTEKEKVALINEAAMGNMKAVMDGLEQLKRNKDVDKNAIRKMEATLTDFAGVQFPKGITKEQKSLLYLEVEKKKAYEEAAKQSEFGSYYKDKIKEADAAIKEILDNPKGATGKVKKLTKEVDAEIEATANDPFNLRSTTVQMPDEVAASQKETTTVEAKDTTPETKKSGVSVVLPESNVPRAEIEPIKVQEEVTMAGVPKEEAGSGGEVGNVEIKNEGNADSPTKESVLKRLDINNPFYQKIAQGLEKLGLIKKYDAETKTGDVVGGYLQKDGKGGFAAGDMYFKADGSISYIKGDNIVTFDKNGNITSHNTKEVKAKQQQSEIDGKKSSIKLLETTRDSEGFKYKTVNEVDGIGNSKKVKRLKTAQELKESTNKINAEINKTKSELADLEKPAPNETQQNSETKAEVATADSEAAQKGTESVIEGGNEVSGDELKQQPKTGQPLNTDAFHGTDADIKEFDVNRNEAKDNRLIEGVGWFSNHEAGAKAFGGKTISGQIKFDNPLVVDAKDYVGRESRFKMQDGNYVYEIDYIKQRFVQEAKDKGHDGVVFLNSKDGNMIGTVYAVFKNENIKIANDTPTSPTKPVPQEEVGSRIDVVTHNDFAKLSEGGKPVDMATVADNLLPNIKEGDKVTFFAEKERKGVWDAKNKKIVDDKGNKWGVIGILGDKNGYIKIEQSKSQPKPAPNETQQNSETKAEVATADSEVAQKGTESVSEGEGKAGVGELKGEATSNVADKKTVTVGGFEFTDTPTLTEKDGLKVTQLPKEDADLIAQQIFVTDNKNTVTEGVSNEGGGWYSFDTDTFGGKTLYNKETGEAVSLEHKKGGRMGIIINDFIKNNGRTKPTESTPTSPTKPVPQATAKPELQGTKKTVSKSADADRQAGAERAVPVDGVKKKTTAADVKTAESQLSAAEGKLRKAEREVGSTQATQQGMFGGNQKGMFAMGRAEAKAALDPLRKAVKDAKANLEKTKKRFEVDSAEAQQELFNNSKTTYETKDGNYRLKTVEGKPTVINNKTGNPASREVAKRIMEEAAENTDFSKGETADFDKAVAEGKNFDGASDKEIDDWTIENSSNPAEIAEIYLKQEPIQEVYSTKDEAIEAIGISQVKESSFAEFDDANNQTQGMAKTYFARKGEKGYTLDVVAKEISDTTGIEVSPADVADYMKRFPNGRVERKTLNGNPIAEAAKAKFTELTGLPLNEAMAERAIMQEAAKQTRAEQEWIETLTNEHKTAEDDYYKSLTAEKQDKAVGNDTAATPSVEEPGNPKQTGSGGEGKEKQPETVKFEFADGTTPTGKVIGKEDGLFVVQDKRGIKYRIEESQILEKDGAKVRDATPRTPEEIKASKTQAKKLADKIRKVADQIGNAKLGGDGAAMSDLSAIPRKLIQAAMKGVAEIIEGGGTIADGIAHFVEKAKGWLDKEKVFYNERSLKKQAEDYFKSAGLIEADKETTIKQDIKAATQTGKVTGDKVTMSAKDALKKQIKDVGRGWRMGMAKGMKAGKQSEKDKNKAAFIALSDAKQQLNEIVGIAKERGVFEGETGSKVIARLVKEITGINTIKQAEKVAAKLDKILDNIEYEKDLQLANDARTAVVKALKTKSSTLSAATKEIIKDFLKLRPQSVTDIREYVDNAKAILTVAKGLKVKGDAFGATTTNDVFEISNKDIEKYTAHERSVMEARAEADFKETYQDLIDAGVIDPKTMSLKEMQEMVDAINSDVDADIDAAAEKMAANENKMKALRNVVEYNRMGLEDYEATDPNLSKQQLQILKALRGIDTADLTAPMLVKMNGVINEIVTNGNFVGSGEMALIHTVQQNVPAIKEVFAKYKIEHLGEPGKLAASLTSMQLLFEYITKNRHAAAELQRMSGIFDIFNGHAKAQDVQIKAVDEYGRMKKKMGRATDNAINRFRRGILADVANNFGGTAEDMQLEFNRRKAWVKTTVDRLKEGTEREQQEAAIIEQAYNELLEGSESYADVLAKSDKVNANNSTLVEFWRKQYADRQAMTIEDAELFNNRVFEPVNNYTSTKLKGLENTESVVRKGEDDLLKETHIGRSINSKASGTKSSKSSAASPARNTVLDLDFDRVQAKRFYETNYDVEAGKHIAMARMFFATKGTNDLFGGIKNKALVKDALVKSIQNQKGVTPQEEAVWKVVKKAVNVLSSKGVRIALGSITQVAKQTFGVFSNAIPNMGKDVDLLMKATAQYHMQRAGANELMNQFSIGIRGRQAQAGTNKEVNIEDGGQAQITNMDEVVGRATDISKKIADGIMYSLKAGDAGIAKSTWLAYYMKSLRSQGVSTENINFSTEAKAPNQKAAAYAEQMVSRTQTPNDPSALGNLNKTMTTPGRIVKNVMLPFSTFSNNQLARSIADIQQLKKGTAKDAAASLAGTMLEAIVFNTVKVFLIGSLATKGVNAAATALGFRDEEDEAKDANREHLTIKTPFGDRATNAKTKKVIAQSISDVFFNGMGNTVQNTLNSGANWAYRNMAEEYMQDGTKVANPTLFYVPESGKVNYGSYQPMLDQGAEFLDNASYLDGKTDKITKGEGVKNEVEVVDITPEERKARTLSAAINFFALAGLSDAEITHANTKLKRMIDNKMTEKYGKAKAYVVDAIAKTRDEGLANEIESRRETIKAAAQQYLQKKEFDAATKANIAQYQIEDSEIQKEADKPVFTKEQTRFKNSDMEGKLYKWAKMTDAERDEMAQFVTKESVQDFVHDYIKSKRFQDPMADKETGELPTNATLADFKKIYKNPLLAALKHMEYRAVPKKQKPTATAEPKDDDE